MKTWNFKVRSNVQEIIKKLDTTLGSADGFVFDLNHSKNNKAAFKVHKRGLYAFNLMFVNKIIVDGKILEADAADETTIEISFTQYFLWKLIILTHFLLGLGFLIAILSNIGGSPYMYIFGGVLLAVGVVLWISVQRKFKKDVQEYKTLISKILKS